ncbi:MAG: GAF domain-containing sensor histidine kinase [Elusimicrobia bacterium]|nr:GAF domain-containing sensor histidine kinase [Elusimicrobiota bacterium]
MNLTEQNLNLLLEANRILSSTLNTDEVLLKIMELATQIVSAESASLLLYEEKTNELTFDVVIGGEKEQKIKQLKLKIGEGIAGWVAKEKKSLVVNNVSSDKRWAKHVDRLSEFKTNSLIAVPLLYKDKLLGVIETINHKDGTDFTGKDLELLEAFSAQAAISIETSTLFSRLNTEKEKFELIFSQMTDAALFFDTTGDIIFCNNACSSLVGLMKNDIFSTFKSFTITPDFKTAFNDSNDTTTINFSHKERQLYFSGKLNRILNEIKKPIGYMLLFHDVTEERREQILKKNFLSLISHKLKTPLVSIIGYSDIVSQKFDTASEEKHFLDIINQQGQHLDDLVNKLLDFTIIESEQHKIERKPVKLNEIVQKVMMKMQDFVYLNKADVTIHPSLNEVSLVIADESMIIIVLKNLIENAIKFNPNCQKSVTLERYETGNMAGISVQDNGPGISPEQKPKLFQEFFQIEESFTGQVKGMGLGLATCKLIIEAHKGKIGIDNNSKNGSKFFFLLDKNIPKQ